MPIDSGPSQTDVVLQSIKEMIVSGRLGAGDRLPIERDLAAELGVSRGSLREGVRALAIMGVLETRQGDGTYVTSLDPGVLLSPLGFLADLQTRNNDVHLLGVRRVLEAESAARAAALITAPELERLSSILDEADAVLSGDPPVDLEAFIHSDTEFHRGIARASGNPALSALIETLIGRTLRTRLWRAIGENDAVSHTQLEHRAILRELRHHEPDRARLRMSMHVLDVEEYAFSHTSDSAVET